MAKQKRSPFSQTIFRTFSRGIETARDEWTYAFNADGLTDKVKRLIETYNSELDRWRRAKKPKDVDDFVTYDGTKIKWSSRLKETFQREISAEFNESNIRTSLYRPFTKRSAYFDPILTHRRGIFAGAIPNPQVENRVLCCTNHLQIPFSAQMTDCTPDFAVGGRAGQCFPFHMYDEDGTNRRENITDWALEHFRKHYGDAKIAKWDIFYYVYGVLHHPAYRAKYAGNLKRELPRIPMVGAGLAPPSPETTSKNKGTASRTPTGGVNAFWAVAKSGQELARLHIDYEKLEPYPLKYVETCAVAPASRRQAGKENVPAGGQRYNTLPLSYRVEDKMRLAKDRRSLQVNPSLTLAGIPPETFEYRLGNRSALEWVIDQYRVTEDERSGIHSDPNRADDPEYIVRLVGQVIQVSLETVKLVKCLPAL